METRENKIQSFEFCKFTGKFRHQFHLTSTFKNIIQSSAFVFDA